MRYRTLTPYRRSFGNRPYSPVAVAVAVTITITITIPIPSQSSITVPVTCFAPGTSSAMEHFLHHPG